MAKARKVRSMSRPSSKPKPPERTEQENEWEHIRCPVCMEHPHSAVLLECSSHHKGCRPYMCHTGPRHSNCLDQFLKASSSFSSPFCPLCRGRILGYSPSAPARAHLDRQPRSCSVEGCGFSGSYPELRRHVRSNHSSARPTEVDPARRLNWAKLEQMWAHNDVLALVNQEASRVGNPGGLNNRRAPARR